MSHTVTHPTSLRDLPVSPILDESGHSRPLAETWAWVRPKLRSVPITRIINVTPIGMLGLPVWSAVTPLAKDLTVHAGKGGSPVAARLSAVMEAIERVCAEEIEPWRVIRGSYRSLAAREGIEVADPAAFSLPFETTYTPDRDISWIAGIDLFTGREVLVALDLVLSPPSEGVCIGVETNGLASGNDLSEAIVHALFELIERDALSAAEFRRLMLDSSDRAWRRAVGIDPSTLPSECLGWVARIYAIGATVGIEEITTNPALPVFRVSLHDPNFLGAADEICVEGYGADLSRRRAIFRGLTEAVQGHTLLTLGSRDTFEGLEPLPDRQGWLLNKLDERFPSMLVPFACESAPMPATQRETLSTTLAALAHQGLERCIAVDLTKAELDVPVVRVLAPGLSSPFGASMRRPTKSLLEQLV